MGDLRILTDAIEEISGSVDQMENDKLKRLLLNKLKAKECDEAIIDCVAKETDLKKLIRHFADYKNIQMCFMVDVTGSMARHKSLTNRFIALLTKAVSEAYLSNSGSFGGGGNQITYAYIGYRERDEKIEIVDFSDNQEKVLNSIRNTVLTGGGDACEDVEFGFQTLFNEINWSFAGTRILIHIADAPCHGDRYHDICINDDHPDWSNNIPKQLKKLVNNFRVFYWFAKLTDDTDKMIMEFNDILEKIGEENPAVKEICQIYEMDMTAARDVIKDVILRQLQNIILTAMKTVN